MLKRWQHGFSLAEMAIVLLIVGILMTSGLGALSSQMNNQRFKETKQMLDRANEALQGYALMNKRLPCPANSTGGESRDPTTLSCVIANGSPTKDYGDLPWQALGLPELDSWGRRLKYRVALTYATQTTTCGTSSLQTCFSLSTSMPVAEGNTIKSASRRNGASVTAINLISSATPAVAVIFSEGATGSSTGDDEVANRNGDTTFVQDSPDAEFDDILVWLPINQFLYRLSTAGVLKEN